VYDVANRLTSRQFGGSGQTPARIDLAYTNRNELSTLSRYSDVAGTTLLGTTSYTYDGAGDMTSVVHRKAAGATHSYYNYAFDGALQVTSETSQTGTHSYSYDATGQLTSDGTNNYSYDANGNRTMTGYQTGVANRLTNDGVYTYTYDAE